MVHSPIRPSNLVSSPQDKTHHLPPQLLLQLRPVELRPGETVKALFIFSIYFMKMRVLEHFPDYVNCSTEMSLPRPQDWPQAMKEYVQRCFTACESEEDKDRTEKVLKEVLQDRLKDGSAYTIDWTREPLPE